MAASKGGVGKTTLTGLLAVAASQAGVGCRRRPAGFAAVLGPVTLTGWATG